MVEVAGLSLWPVQSRVRPVWGVAVKPAGCCGVEVGKNTPPVQGLWKHHLRFLPSLPQGAPGGYPIRSKVLNLPEPVSCLYHGDSAFLVGLLHT